MKRCPKCSKIFKDSENFCPECGVELIKDDSINEEEVNSGSGEYRYSSLEEDARDNKGLSILCYLGVLVLIPILCNKKNSKFVKFHANQGLILLILEAIVNAAFNSLSLIPHVGSVFKWVSWGFDVILLIFAILGIVAAANGEEKELPIIGKYRILK